MTETKDTDNDLTFESALQLNALLSRIVDSREGYRQAAVPTLPNEIREVLQNQRSIIEAEISELQSLETQFLARAREAGLRRRLELET